MGLDTTLTRAALLKGGAAIALLGALGTSVAWAAEKQPTVWTIEDLRRLAALLGLNFSDVELKAALPEVIENFSAAGRLRISYPAPPATPFVPIGRQPARGNRVEVPLRRARPASTDPIGMSLVELSNLIRARKISPVSITEAFLQRIELLNPKLNCVVTLNREGALREARQAEGEIAEGKWRGPLHGIPYALKDLFSTRGLPTTWGAEPFRDQRIEEDAAVVERLRAAGAVLLAKVSLGALAMDDKWFGGQTKNPWDLRQGSSGSSAGSACAVAAGLCTFAIGTETLGSIVSPSQRCRVTGLRPTFGRISRHGAMALSWTMDKVGPITRTAEDALLVLAALCGEDPRDTASQSRPLIARRKLEIAKLRIGVLGDGQPLDESDANRPEWLEPLRQLGANLEPVKVSMPNPSSLTGLSVEAATAFDAITRSGEVNSLTYSLWPQIFRSHRFFTAVEYLQGLRQRSLDAERFEAEFGDLDLIVAPDRGAQLLFITNLTGHPQLYIPLGAQGGMSIVGRLWDEATVCALGEAIQRVTNEHLKLPPL